MMLASLCRLPGSAVINISSGTSANVMNGWSAYCCEETARCEPVFAALAGMLLLREGLTLHTVLGAGMILLALSLSELDVKKILSKRMTAAT